MTYLNQAIFAANRWARVAYDPALKRMTVLSDGTGDATVTGAADSGGAATVELDGISLPLTGLGVGTADGYLFNDPASGADYFFSGSVLTPGAVLGVDAPAGPVFASAAADLLTGSVYAWNSHVALSGVSVSVTGAATGSGATDSSGAYSIAGLADGSYTLSASLAPGNLGHTITAADALAALKLSIGVNPNALVNGVRLPVSPFAYIAADANGDGRVTAADALAILKMSIGLSNAIVPSWKFVDTGSTFWNAAGSAITVSAASVPTSFAVSPTLSGSGADDLVGVLKGDVLGRYVPLDSNGTAIANPVKASNDYYYALGALTAAPTWVWGVTPAVPPVLAAALANDTGTSATDGITSDATIAGTLTDAVTLTSFKATLDGGTATIDLSGVLGAGGTFGLTPAQLAGLAGGTLADGAHTVHLAVSDVAGNAASADVNFTLDTAAPTVPNTAVAAGFDDISTTPNATTNARIDLVGTTTPGVLVTAVGTGVVTLADSTGAFRLVGVPLSVGTNALTVAATDAAGNAADGSVSVTRATGAANNVVLTWNQVALDSVQAVAMDPQFASRALAIESIAVLDTANAINGAPGFLVHLAPPSGISLNAALAAAAHEALIKLFPSQAAALDTQLATDLAGEPAGALTDAAVAYGKAVADAVVAIRANDGSANTTVTADGSTVAGQWRPTPPAYTSGQDPQFGNVTPFALTSATEFTTPGPPAIGSAAYNAAVAQVDSLGAANSTTRTADQTQAALFWNDQNGTYTPPGEWNLIATGVASTEGLGTLTDAQMLAELNVALADAGISTWNVKYADNLWRPISAIQAGSGVTADPNWTPLLTTPNFPSYVSGHSTFSAAAADVLTALIGNASFSVGSLSLPGVTRSFTSFDAAAQEAAMSRVWAGIHYLFDSTDGMALGASIGADVVQVFQSQATRVSLVLSGGTVVASGGSLSIAGFAFDNAAPLSAVQVSIDGGTAVDVAVDAGGAFSTTAQALFGAIGNGAHIVTVSAADGSAASQATIDWTVEDVPAIQITSPLDAGTLSAGMALTGTASVAGGTLTSLSYSLDSGTAVPVGYDAATGAFNTTLDLSGLAAGAHTLTIQAGDAAGTTSVTLNETLAAAVPLTVVSVSPPSGAQTVGVTFRPQVVFSRAVDPSTLTPSSFYATDSAGNVLAANVVASADGTTATLFFTNAMPSASTVTLHVVGSLIQAADGTPLDAAGTGAGSTLSTTLSTVSTDIVPNTTITGILADPGADGLPMTADDIATNPDGSYTYLHPIAGVTVSVLGVPGATAVTAADGSFTLTDVPAGDVKVVLNGTTATNPPSGVYFPEMTMDVVVQPGVTNTIMGGMGDPTQQAARAGFLGVYLPRVVSGILTPVSDSVPTTVTGPTSAPGTKLTAAQLAQISLTVQPGSVVDANGNPLSGTTIGVAPVPSTIVQDMLPAGILQHTFDITIQSRGATSSDPGGAQFTVPATLTLPNTLGLAPGEKTYVLSFDHTTGRLVIDGTATVSADGLTITTDPGSGVTKPGWHGITPPGSQGNSAGYGSGGHTRSIGSTDPNCTPDGSKIEAAKHVVLTILPTVGGILNSINATKAAVGLFKQGVLGTVAGGFGGGFNIGTGIVNGDPKKIAEGVAKVAIVAGTILAPELAVPLLVANAAIARFDAQTEFPKAQKALADLDQAYQDCVPTPPPNSQVAATKAALTASLATAQTQFTAQQPLYEDMYAKIKAFADQMVALALQNAALQKQPGGVAAETPEQLAVEEAAINALIAAEQAAEAAAAKVAAAPPLAPIVDDMQKKYAAYVQAVGADTSGEPGADPSAVGNNLYAVLTDSSGNAQRFSFDDSVGFSNFLAPDTNYDLTVYDPSSGYVGSTSFTSGASGTPTAIPVVPMAPDLGTVGPGGLTEISGLVMGLDPTKMSNLIPGVTDRAAILDGLNNHKTLLTQNGVLANLSLAGEATRLVLAGSNSSPTAINAFVATGSYGMAVVDVSNPLSPQVLSQIQLAGTSSGIAVDTALGRAVVASGSGGVHLLDISIPGAPVLLSTLNINATMAVINGGIAYVDDNGTSIDAIDLATGTVLGQIALGGVALNAMAQEGNTLYVTNTSGLLSAITLSGGTMHLFSSINVPAAGGLEVANGVVYVAGRYPTGLATVQGGDGVPLTVIQDYYNGFGTNISNRAVALNGSGTAIGLTNDFFNGNQIEVLNIADPTSLAIFQTRYTLPVAPQDVAIGDGLAFVADATGLAVVNYSTIDTSGVGPTITVNATPGGNAGGASAVTLTEGSVATFAAQFSDPGQIANVQVLLNGVAVVSDVSYPYDLSTVLPSIAANGGSTLTLALQATDTAGHTAISAPVTVTLLRDTTAPMLVSQSLAPASTQGYGLQAITYTFSKPIAAASLVPANFALIGPGGATILPVSVQARVNATQVQVTYPAMAAGAYTADILAANVTDRAGNALGAGTITTGFTVDGSLAIWNNPLGGRWGDAPNWLAQALPASTDTAELALSQHETITLDSGLAALGALHQDGGTLVMTGGTLSAASGIDVRSSTLALNGGIVLNTRLQTETGSIAYAGVLLDGVSTLGSFWIGPAGGTAFIANGLTAGNGTIDLTGPNGGTVYISDSTFVPGQTVLLGGSAGASQLIEQVGLTLDATTRVRLDHGTGELDGANGLTVAGSIAATVGTLRINETSFSNTGTMSAGAGGTLDLEGSSFVNSGRVSIAAASTLKLGYYETLSNTGTIIIDAGGTLALDGDAAVGTLNGVGNGGDLRIDGTLDLGGGTMDVTPTGLFSHVTLAGTLANGTLKLSGGIFDSPAGNSIYQSPVLQDVTLIGSLAAPSLLALAGSFTVQPVSGQSRGTLDMTVLPANGSSAQLGLLSSMTLDNLALIMGTPGAQDLIGPVQSNIDATFGANALVQQRNGRINIGASGTLINQGTFDLSGGAAQIYAGTLVANAGLLSLSNRESVSVGGALVSNSGIIAIGDGGTVDVGAQSTISNTGTITIAAGGVLAIEGATTRAALGLITGAGTVLVRGTLDLGGGTIDAAPGGTYAALTFGYAGQIANGTVLNSSGLALAAGSMALDNVVYDGVLRPVGNVTVMGSLVVRDSASASRGTIDLTQPGAGLTLGNDLSLDATTLLLANSTVGGYGTKLLLGAATQAEIVAGYNAFYLGEVDNSGTVQVLAGNLSVNGTLVSNTGSITVAGGATFDGSATTLANDGTIRVDAYGTLAVDYQETLTGAGAISVGSGGSMQIRGMRAGTGSITLAAGGTLEISQSMGIAALAGITDAGTLLIDAGATLDLGGGTLDLATGHAFSNVALNGVIANGTVRAEAGGLITLGANGSIDPAVTVIGTPVAVRTVLDYTTNMDLAGGTLAIAAGTIDFLQQGTLHNGTIVATGGFASQYGTLDHMTFIGVLRPGQDLRITGGLTVLDSPGASRGTLDLSGATTFLMDNETLDNITLFSNSYSTFYLNTNATSLTLGTHGLLLMEGGTLQMSGGALDNRGTIAVTAGTLTSSASTLDNEGTLTVGGGGSISVNYGTLLNSGRIALAAGAVLNTGTLGFVNTGTVTLDSGATLAVGAPVTLSGLGTIIGTGTVRVDGTLDLGGGTLDGAVLPGLTLDGMLANGTVIDTAALTLGSSATLSNITWDAAFAPSGYTYLSGTLTVRDSAVASRGTITLAGNGVLALNNSMTLDHETLVLQSGGAVQTAQTGVVVTIAASSQIVQTGGAASFYDRGAGVFDNQGTMTLGGGALASLFARTQNEGTLALTNGEQFKLTSGSLINSGTISIDGNALLSTGTGLSNTGSIVIGALGTLEVAGSTTLAGLGNIANAGVMKLSGTLDLTGGTMDLAPGTKFADVMLGGTLHGGTLKLDGGIVSVPGSVTLDGVAVIGSLAGLGGAVNFVNSLSVLLTASATRGTIDLTQGTQIRAGGSLTIANTLIEVGPGSANAAFDYATHAIAVTLDAATTVVQDGGSATFDFSAYYAYGDDADVLVNLGTMQLAAGAMNFGMNTIDNAGAIVLSTGETLTLGQGYGHGTLVNTGSIGIGTDSVLHTGINRLVNSGTIAIGARGTLDVGGTFDLASLGTLTGTGELLISGTLDLGGGTLDVAANTGFGNVLVTGKVINGTVLQDGGVFTLGNGGQLSGVVLAGH